MKTIHLNLTGGLGNQIFEILYCSSYFDTQKSEVKIIINTFYLNQYKTKRDFELKQLLSILDINYEIVNHSSLRLSKIMSKLFRKDLSLNLGGHLFVDSYHQNFNDYSSSQIQRLGHIICKIRNNIDVKTKNECCLHHRLTDFTENQTPEKISAEIDFFKKQLKNATCVVITDDINEFSDIAGDRLITSSVFDFKELTPWALLLEFSQYQTLLSNGSTLSFFGALFGKCNNYITINKVLDCNFKLINSNNVQVKNLVK